jgi:hypothetical protein
MAIFTITINYRIIQSFLFLIDKEITPIDEPLWAKTEEQLHLCAGRKYKFEKFILSYQRKKTTDVSVA